MYNYPQYKETDREKILSFMKANPFATIIATSAAGRVEATQVPLLLEEKEGRIFLYGHLSRKSDHYKALVENPRALVIFTGPNSYVSGTWYTGNLQQASTWNYVSIHARGEMKWMDEQGLIGFLKRFTLYFEQGNKASTTIYDNLPDNYRLPLVKAIDGFEMEVTELDNVHKLSQNRDEKSYDNIVEQLKRIPGDARTIGEMMEERKGKVFP